VKSAGVTVGRVSSIALDGKTFQGVVTMELEKRYAFPKDTSRRSSPRPARRPVRGAEPRRRGREPGRRRHDQDDAVAVVLENLIGQMLYNRAAEGGSEAKK